jgi:hypothetical protein
MALTAAASTTLAAGVGGVAVVRSVRRAQDRQRRLHALRLNDDIVQGLAVAKYALAAGDVATAADAVDATLGSAKNIVGNLLRPRHGIQPVEPGDLVRMKPAGGSPPAIRL